MNLFGRYRRITRYVYVTLIGITSIVFAVYLQSMFSSRLKLFTDRFLITSSTVKFLLRGVNDQIEGARTQAERLYKEDSIAQTGDWLVNYLRDKPDSSFNQFLSNGVVATLDMLVPPLSNSFCGNVLLQGPMSNITPQVRKELRVMMSLFPYFKMLMNNLGTVKLCSANSTNGQLCIYPWVHSEVIYSNVVLWTGNTENLEAQNALNDQLILSGHLTNYWRKGPLFSRVSNDELGFGLEVICVAPYYEGNELRGGISTSILVEDLKYYLSPLNDLTRCAVLLVNNYQQLVARSDGYKVPRNKPIMSLSEAMPQSLTNYATAIAQTAPALGWTTEKKENLHSCRLGTWLIFKKDLEVANMEMVMFVHWPSVLWDLIREAALLLGSFLIALIVIVLGSETMARREIIHPAEKLVGHLEAASKDPTAKPPLVPAPWRPCLDTVSNIFRENHKLMEDLREENINLDALVTQRTAQLAERNRDLAKANSEIESLHQSLSKENLRLAAEVAVAQRLETMILPKQNDIDGVGGIQIAYTKEPTGNKAAAGDYFDLLNNGPLIKVGIGHVSGRGLESGVLLVMLQTAAWTLLDGGERDPVRFLGALRRVIVRNTERIGASNSVALTFVDFGAHSVTVCGEQEYVLVMHGDASWQTIAEPPAQELEPGAELPVATPKTIPFAETDTLVLFPRRVVTAKSPSGEAYGEERLIACLRKNRQAALGTLKAALLADLCAFAQCAPALYEAAIVVARRK